MTRYTSHDWHSEWPIGFPMEDMQHQVGDDIYIPTSLYLSHGADDFRGGLCKITAIEYGGSAGKRVPFIQVAERPGHEYNYKFLLEQQEDLRTKCGKRRGRPDPDHRPEFNRWN